MTAPHRFRCGDTARIEGTDYDIEIAYADYESGSASWCGWPEGRVEISKLTLVKACSDEEHKAAVAMWCDRDETGGEADHRRTAIQRLYRPRAYWRGVLRIVRERLESDRQAESGATFALQQAEAGPEDA
ncbi:MAG: hypothetical protein ABL998_00845 [Planctomycetota bacterium]